MDQIWLHYNIKWRNGNIKIVKSLEEPDLLPGGARKPIKNETKEQKDAFLDELLGILATTFLRNMLTDKAKKPGWEVTRAGEGTIRAAQDF